jgi:fatty-acyl-CoA synthase
LRQHALTIPAALRAAANRNEGEYVFHLGEGPVRLSCAELAEHAEKRARQLIALGVRPGDPVSLLGRNRPEWAIWSFAVWCAGAVLVPLQFPLRIRDPGAFAAQLRNLIDAAGCERVVVEPRMAGHLPAGIAVAWDGEADATGEALPPVAPQDAAAIQFTSGSTATPRGALVTHAAVMAQMEILDEYLAVEGKGRTTVSWTPYFHDLGLYMNVIPAAVWGLSSHHLPTERFARDPAEWFRLAAATRASFTLAPSSAFGNALRALQRRDERVDLGAMEMARFGTEGVDPGVVQRLNEDASRLGLRPEALGSSYGLAEAVLAVTLSPPGSGLSLDRISIDALASDGIATPAGAGPSRTLVGCGPPRMELRIVGPDGEERAEREVGQIILRGASLMGRYVGPGASDPFADGWLQTGDLGYLAAGELFVTGRVKDVVMVMGGNYYPEDFEWAAGRVDGIRPGRCAAFAEPGTDRVVVLVEPNGNGDSATLRGTVRNAVADAVGISPPEVVVVPPGTVRKTTSGKLRRATMRDLYLTGALSDSAS